MRRQASRLAAGRKVLVTAVAAAAFALPAYAHAAFPGDNGKVVFKSNGINVMNPDGSVQTRLTSNASDSSATWAPNGARIAFNRNQGDVSCPSDATNGFVYPAAGEAGGTSAQPCNFEIYSMNSDGTNITRLTTNPAYDAGPAWSPDGTKIAFVGLREGHCCFSDDYLKPEIYVMNADGSNQTRLTFTTRCAIDPSYQTPGPCPLKGGPVWSPDGTKIAFTSSDYQYNPDGNYYTFEWSPGPGDIWIMNSDGTSMTNITQTPSVYEASPEWSPSGDKIAFVKAGSNGWDIWTMNPDGSAATNLTGGWPSSPGWSEYGPVWSPDGRKILFSTPSSNGFGRYQIFSMNSEGSAKTVITNDSISAFADSWQPLRPYPRPVGASPLEVSFVPAFKPCETVSANAQHGPPLNFPSCSSPTPTSSTARIGPNTLSLLRIVVCPANATSAFCNPAAGMPKPDVRFAGSIRDVRCAGSVPAGCSPGADYNPNTAPGPYTDGGNGKTGAQPPCLPSGSSTTACLAGADLTEVAEIPGASLGAVGTPFEGRGVRITDRNNLQATTVDIGFPVPLDCIPTADTTQGSTCGVNTTANALVPGAVVNGDTGVWQIGQVELRDSGRDGTRGNSDDELFATQGVFLP